MDFNVEALRDLIHVTSQRAKSIQEEAEIENAWSTVLAYLPKDMLLQAIEGKAAVITCTEAGECLIEDCPWDEGKHCEIAKNLALSAYDDDERCSDS